ncbi:hypothetical protein HYY72_03975 [Candidatus Woesearchaeota archaeon]|nr:hypothetical protein [Candidatus Woesearchaeota archaeon]
MLTRILDTGIDISDPEIRWELETDLRRMDRLPHDDVPENADAYMVKVTPSVRTYMPGLHRFRFELQYGRMNNGAFEPEGKPALYQTETLPMI